MSLAAAVDLAVQLEPQQAGCLLQAVLHARRAGLHGRQAVLTAFSLFHAGKMLPCPPALNLLGDFCQAVAPLERLLAGVQQSG